MGKAVLIGKFYPPSKGHQFFIDFARSHPEIEQTHVIVCSLDSESIPGKDRADALRQHYAFDDNTYIYLHHGDMPQYPEEAENFWDQWRNLILSYIDVAKDGSDIVFASEAYGERLAKELNCRFIPVDIQRQTIDISATRIRNNPLEHFDNILPEFRTRYITQVSFVGAESCGKTTTSRDLAARFNAYWLPEYARGYLDHKGAELDDQKMQDIAEGQIAIERAAAGYSDKPYVFKDTDLLTCLGWRRRYNLDEPQWLVDAFRATQSHLYLLLDEDIPFTQDPLRYGGDHRETDSAFWEQILKDYGVAYEKISGLDYADRTQRAERAIKNFRR